MARKRGFKIENPADIRRAASKILNEIIKSDSMVEHAGKFSSVAHVFLKAWELDAVSDIEKRITTLEEAQQDEHSNP